MFDLQRKMKSLSIGRQLEAVTGVIIHAGQDSQGNEKVYSSGDDSGYVIEMDNDMGTQEIADSILASLKLRGYRYQPYDAGGAILDPAAEIGDAVSVNGTVSVIGSMATRHGRLMESDIAAPYDEEVNHEFQFVPRTQREFRRESARTRARLTIAEDSIEAKVSKEGDDGSAESFSWKLLSNSHSWYANDTLVMRVNRNGLRIEGEVYATSGRIGDAEIINGHLTVDGANIRNLNADYITVGTLSVDRLLDHSVTGTKVAYNTLSGGSGGNIMGSTISTHNTVSGINTNLGYGAAYGAVTSTDNSSSYPDYFKAGTLRVTSILYAQTFVYKSRTCSWEYHTVDGSSRWILVGSGTGE